MFMVVSSYIIPFFSWSDIGKGISPDGNVTVTLLSCSSSTGVTTYDNVTVSITIRRIPNGNSATCSTIICLRTNTKSNIVALSSFSLGYDISLRINKA